MLSAAIPTVVILGLVFCASGGCDTHYVSPEGSDQAPYLTPETAASSIQSALDAASPGDTVSVAPGDYNENIVMGPGLRLVGAGADNTRIWGSIRAGVDAEITGLGVAQDCPPEDPAFARDAVEGPRTGGLIVAECRISGTFERGILCQADAGFALIVDSEVRGITGARGEGIGVWGQYGARPLVCVIDGCVVEDCRTGVAASSEHGVWVMRTRLSRNRTGVWVGNLATLAACQVEGNEYGVTVYDCAAATIESSALTRNAEAGLRCQDASRVEVTNSTIAANGAGVTMCYPDWVAATSCIIWGNAEDVRMTISEPAWRFTADFCDIGAGWEGIQKQNIDADPLFQNPDEGNYRLTPRSPCIDAGTDAAYPLRTAYDLDGKSRVAYGGIERYKVDMGAYEYYINDLEPGPGLEQTTLTWSSLADKTYSIFYTDDLLTWHLADDNVPSFGNETTFWTDDGSLTGVPPCLARRRFYRVLENW